MKRSEFKESHTVRSGLPCPCGSSDALSEYSDGHTHCYSCDTTIQPKGGAKVTSDVEEEEEFDEVVPGTFPELDGSVIGPIEARGIPEWACREAGVRVKFSEVTGSVVQHFYPYYDADGQVIQMYKRRIVDGKEFKTFGSSKKVQLFCQHLCKGRRLVIVVEGEMDRLAARVMLKAKGKDYDVVSLVFGAKTLKSLRDNIEFLESYETVTFAMDNDGAGIEGVAKAAALLSTGKAKIARLPLKDPNDMLQKGRTDDFLKCIFAAKVKRPDGLVTSDDTWEALMLKDRDGGIPYPESWVKMNQMAYGMRRGELETWTSGSGSGKTQIFRELQYHILTQSDVGIGIISLEEPLTESVEALMALDMSKRISLPDIEYTQEEYREAWENTQGTGRITYYDHFGSMGDDTILSKIRFMARAEGRSHIFLDHLSILVSEFASDGGERERIDTLMTKLKSLTQELDIWIGLIVHLVKTSGMKSATFEQGRMPTLDDLRGSASIKQLSNSVMATARDQQEEDQRKRNTSQVAVLKCRFSGRTGMSDLLYYNTDTGRMEVVEADEEDFEDEF